ncbi:MULTISPECIES: alpha-L-fucosidase [unclassified Sphingobacterium]|uniref:alpha-L-fucosidase n=1 Tax=unclassified Sphingobacterium TaxID=2609468 RepID=UPI00105070F6|nr:MULTISPECIES: alpha-L-fucosidase [unclassified Sphingobacterium]MCS3556242.1 alpha-L-fucosidase [Sphingobacterium sp. JUb21]TCR08613.1 alpha-L-fucosidase [Sphingobacterium sp. JUb20]
MKVTKLIRSICQFVLLCYFNSTIAQVVAQEIPIPNAQQLAWQQAELGVVFHYDIHVFDNKPYNQADNRITPISNIHLFKPAHLDVEQWVISAKEAGAKFAIITATHETGFALYPSKANPYNTSALGWKNGKEDLVGDFIKACRKHDIKPGVYLGIRWNSYLGIHDFKAIGTGAVQVKRQQDYNEMVEKMVTEICTWYGPLFEIWFDGGASSPDKGAPNVLPIVKKYQPNSLFYHNDQLAEARWGGSETGAVNYPCWSTFPFPYTGAGESAPEAIYKNGYALLKTGDPDGSYFMPAMADAPLRGTGGRHEWFWEPGDEKTIYPLSDLMDIYRKSVGRNATLILGVTPDTSGLVPGPDRLRLQELGNEIKRQYGIPIKNTSLQKSLIKFEKLQVVQQLILAEDLSYGQRIRSFHIDAKTKTGWKTIFTGTSIGQKCIISLEHGLNCTEIKLHIDHAIGSPKIINFNAYDTF